MSNWNGSARSNYFKVKDPEAFKKWLDDINCVLIQKDGLSGFYSDDPDTGSFPSQRYDEKEGDHVDINLTSELSDHLADGEVAVLMEAGAEKIRYISGYATAVASDGRTVYVRLSDIYEKAKAAFDVMPTDASY